MKKPFFILLLTLVSALVYAQDTKIIAHRGASGYAPENTLAAFNLAWELGADIIEGDFHLTKDNQVVCIHDKTTLRTSDKNIEVKESTYAQLLELDFGNGEKIPLLTEVIETIPAGKKLFIEIKSGLDVLPYAIDIVKKSKKSIDFFTIISFDAEVIKESKKLMPKMETSLLVFSLSFEEEETIIDKLDSIGADGLSLGTFTSRDIALRNRILNSGKKFHLWTINSKSKGEKYFLLRPNTLTTDKPAFFKKLRDEVQK